MASLLQQLQGSDATLLMYLVGELPAADRVEVERKLGADLELRAELDRLTQAYGSFTSGMEALDAATSRSADVSAAVHRASSAIRQWQVRPVSSITYGVEQRPARRWRIWAIPSAAAAIVLVVVGISLYSTSSVSTHFAQGQLPVLPVPKVGSVELPVVPPPVTPSADEVEKLLADTTPTAGNPDIEALADIGGPTFNRDMPHDDPDVKTPHDDAGAVFEIPLDAGR